MSEAGMSEAGEKEYARELAAIDLLRKHLAREWISEGCGGDDNVWTCASCAAKRLRDDLGSLELELLDKAPVTSLHPLSRARGEEGENGR